jgi:drug/metabolite transporter (DMT)-like permease
MLTALAMLAFAANSLLCRLALRDTGIDAAGFTSVRLVSGAAMLWLIVQFRAESSSRAGNWGSALALFVYAAAFSFAYLSLSAATGALLLFGAVQVTMIGVGLWRGERLSALQTVGLLLALAGLIGLLSPGLSAPPTIGAMLMLMAGCAWGAYSLRGRGVADATAATAGNFLRATPMALALSACTLPQQHLPFNGIAWALASGALTSGVGYVVWYAALRGLKATQAATVQLSVPVLTALGGIAVLGEALSWRVVLAATVILGGIALVLRR